jgi:hypothetical protein
MKYRYDSGTQNAERQLAERQNQPVRKEAALAAFVARSSASALVRDRGAGIHRIHAHGEEGAICTCGLIVDLDDEEELLRLPGHVNPQSGRPVYTLLGYATEHLRGCFPTYEAHCQRCRWSLRAGKLPVLQKSIKAHPMICPAALHAVTNL